MLHGRRHGGELSPVQRDVQVDVWQQPLHQGRQPDNVAQAVFQMLAISSAL